EARSLEGRALSRPKYLTITRKFRDDTSVVPPNMEEIGRKHPIHLDVHDRRDTLLIVYLTVCTKERKPILANPETHELLRAAWREARLWLVGRYVVMPDHIHLFCAPATHLGGTSSVSSQNSGETDLGRHGGRLSSSLEKWTPFWKSQSARHWPNPKRASAWQRHFW